MSTPLPDLLVAYFRYDNAHDADALAQCFSADAAVHDEGAVHRGHAAIRAWKRATAARYGATASPLACQATPHGCVVEARVSGNFPGSPARLVFDFTLDGSAIGGLKIGA